MRMARSLGMLLGCVSVLTGVATGVVAQVEELFSRYVQVFKPQGEFPNHLVKVSPGEGAGWKVVELGRQKLRLAVPEDARVDTAVEGNRTLLVTFGGTTSRPLPVLRIDAYTPKKGDPVTVDAEYATDYADQYSNSAFQGKFNLTDRGLVVRDKKTNFAMVGGVYTQGAVTAHRVQWAYLDAEEQLFLTFDCADADWERYQDVLARSLLSVEIGHPKRK